jgi:serine phosphatase RsbU (regulator of sigma subunit)
MSIMGQLGSLEAAGLVRVAQVEPDLEYLFRHSLVQDAVYTSLLENDRVRLHLMVGETIEKLYPDRLDEFADTLARHFQNAGVDDKAHTYFYKAGKAALQSYANQEAEIQFRRALSLPCCTTERAALLYGLAESLYRQSRFQEALDAFKGGIEHYQAESCWDDVARLYARSARVAWHAGNNVEALRLSNQGLDVVAGSPDSPEMAMLIHEAARSYLFNDLHDKAFQLCKKALQMSEKFNDVAGMADTLATYGVLKKLPEEEAREALERSVQLAEQAGYLGIALRAYHNLAALHGAHEGGREASRKYFKKSAALGRQRGVANEEHYSLVGAVGFARAAGDLTEAEAYLKRMEELARSMPDPGPADFINKAHRAALLFMRGEWEAGIDLARTCSQVAREQGDFASLYEVLGDLVSGLLEMILYQQLEDWSEVEALALERVDLAEEGFGDKRMPNLDLAILRSRQLRIDEAREAMENAVQGLGDEKSPWRLSIINRVDAEISTAAGRYAEAASALEEIVANYARLGARWSWARTLHDLAEVHMKSGSPADYERARGLLREALNLYNEMGATRHAEWMEIRLTALRAKTFKLALVSQQDAQELARAAQIQGSFLPQEVPQISGWELAVTLEPARQTSGDFYDFIPFSKDRWGLLVADVADKGTAAALFMTTSRSLIRTYAADYEIWPEIVLSETNRRLLADTQSGLFVTAFYGVLDPQTGILTYANAGHNPPYLLRQEGDTQPLTRTGTPLGIFEEASWEQNQVRVMPGDSLVIYTDGVIDSQNGSEKLLGAIGLLDSLEKHRNKPAKATRDGILDDVHAFVGDAPQFDDITLLVLTRNTTENE